MRFESIMKGPFLIAIGILIVWSMLRKSDVDAADERTPTPLDASAKLE